MNPPPVHDLLYRAAWLGGLTRGAGPRTTLPSLLYWEPWQGHLNLFSFCISTSTSSDILYTHTLGTDIHVATLSFLDDAGKPGQCFHVKGHCETGERQAHRVPWHDASQMCADSCRNRQTLSVISVGVPEHGTCMLAPQPAHFPNTSLKCCRPSNFTLSVATPCTRRWSYH